ncbi:glutamine--tRNA ligase/YqeY domain fusion protein [Rubrivirga sp. IMCC43871]|uniref:glutamine--tRNA ligase/YqeY domain fusion protein n=1 Tax=Rubrivirga sp. IMCC43871 TaxID=3391575 RepID=UPI00398FFCA6
MSDDRAPKSNFLRDIVAADIEAGTYGGRVVTRFPPEPNGYPHIGHAQSICLNFGLAQEFGGRTNLRYDDTNPEAESQEFADALLDAVEWLGFAPAEVRYASDYFEQLYEWAQDLVRKGLAYVDSQSGDEIRATRGTVTEAGMPSPYRDRPVEESLRLLEEMKDGKHPDGSHVLRAKIDTEHGPMAHPNMKLRDPVMYRIRRDAEHYRRGTEWAIYPLYDWAHGQGDAIEGVTHSVCTLEFDVNRPLYDWYLDAIGIPEPRNHQHEFARFNLDYTVMSKRRLRQLVEGGHVAGWDDPRMPTIAGLRRRGVRPQALRRFFADLGVTKVNGSVEIQQLDYAVRDDLNGTARRVLAVTDPVPLTVEGLATATLDAPYWPHDVTPPADAPTSRPLPISSSLVVERADYADVAPKRWKRLAPGAVVRLRHGPVIECTGADHDADGTVTAIRARLAPDAKPTGVIHWVDASTGLPAAFRLYDRLFSDPNPGAADDFLSLLNPDSLVETEGVVEPSVADDPADTRYQFERVGYFWRDPADSLPGALAFNQIVALKDNWATPTAAPARDEPKATPTPQAPVGPRDPASSLDDAQRETYSALVVRGVGEEEAAVLATDPGLRKLTDDTIASGADPKAAGALVVHDLRRALGHRELSDSKADGPALAAVLAMVEAGTLTRNAAGEAVAGLVERGGTAAGVVEALGLAAVRSEDALAPAIDAALAEHPDEVARYRAGEQRLFGFFVGQAMRRAGKGADPKAVQALLRQRLAG